MAKDPDDRHRAGERAVPVTAEIGSEGGSYSDASVQGETKTGNLPRVDERAAGAPPAGQVADAVRPQPDDPENGIRATRRPTD
jgi:hypothetical protein